MDTAISKEFFSTTYTQVDARRRLNFLDIVIEEATYKTGQKKSFDELLAQKQMNDSDRKFLMKYLNTVKLPSDINDLKKIITGLKEEILKRPLVTLTVAFEPDAAQTDSYGEWFRKNVNPDCLLTIIFSAAVVGGCSISWQGKQVTYDLEYLIKSKRDEILKVVNKYVEINKKEKVI